MHADALLRRIEEDGDVYEPLALAYRGRDPRGDTSLAWALANEHAAEPSLEVAEALVAHILNNPELYEFDRVTFRDWIAATRPILNKLMPDRKAVEVSGGLSVELTCPPPLEYDDLMWLVTTLKELGYGPDQD
jgi:hypothetical protein